MRSGLAFGDRMLRDLSKQLKRGITVFYAVLYLSDRFHETIVFPEAIQKNLADRDSPEPQPKLQRIRQPDTEKAVTRTPHLQSPETQSGAIRPEAMVIRQLNR